MNGKRSLKMDVFTELSIIIEMNAHQNIAETFKRYPVVWERGEGSRLYDRSGKEYIDFFTGHGVMVLGHGHSRLLSAMREQLEKLVHTGNHFHLLPQENLAAALCGSGFGDRVFYANSGGEIVDLAVKLARRRKRILQSGSPAGIVAMEGAFHGRPFGALSLTGQDKYKRDMGPMLSGVSHVPFNDESVLKEAVNDDTAAVLLEPIQGDGGVIPAMSSFLKTARRLCERYNALLIYDEIQTGLGRTGSMYAFQEYDIIPDVLLLGKPLGGGFPLSTLLTSQEIAASLGFGDHGSTFGGNPVACAVGLELLEILHEPGFLERIREKGCLFKQELLELQQQFSGIITEVRGSGLLIGMELNVNAREVCERALNAGLVINNPSGNVLRFLPPYTVSGEEIRKACSLLGSVLAGFR